MNGRRRIVFHRGRWAVEQERFQLGAEVRPTPPFQEALHIARIIPAALGKMTSAEAQDMAQLIAEWTRHVGIPLGEHTRPLRLEKTTLYVGVDHPVWIFELKGALEEEILLRLQHTYGVHKVKHLRWQVVGSDEMGR